MVKPFAPAYQNLLVAHHLADLNALLVQNVRKTKLVKTRSVATHVQERVESERDAK